MSNAFSFRAAFIVFCAIILVAAGLMFYQPAHWSMQPAANNAAPQFIASASYACDGGRTITAAFYQMPGPPPAVVPGEPPQPNGFVWVSLSDGRQMTLAQTISADGARYANPNESFVFWTKGNGAMVMDNATTTYTNCVEAAQ